MPKGANYTFKNMLKGANNSSKNVLKGAIHTPKKVSKGASYNEIHFTSIEKRDIDKSITHTISLFFITSNLLHYSGYTSDTSSKNPCTFFPLYPVHSYRHQRRSDHIS